MMLLGARALLQLACATLVLSSAAHVHCLHDHTSGPQVAAVDSQRSAFPAAGFPPAVHALAQEGQHSRPGKDDVAASPKTHSIIDAPDAPPHRRRLLTEGEKAAAGAINPTGAAHLDASINHGSTDANESSTGARTLYQVLQFPF